jgi:hypothetical protein
MSESTHLKLPFIEAAQVQKHVTHNEAIRRLDAIVQLSVSDRDLTAPPVSSIDGDRYIVATGATGAWAGQDFNVAAWLDGAREFFAPQEGWLAWPRDEDKLLIWNGTAWVDLLEAVDLAGGGITELGLNGASADATNRLAVRSPSILFNRETDDINVTLNKEAAADDARFTFQTGFSTRALFGTLGSDDFGISVSPDGSAFFQALSIDKDTGHVGLGGATAGANNALIVEGTAFLFDAETSDCRFTFNKRAVGDDLALTFQTGYSARALLGLLGGDDFTFKVSDDGAAFTTAMVIDRATGAVAFAEHSKFSATSNFDNYIAANTWTKVQFNSADHNTQGDFDAGTNQFVAPHDGTFLFGAILNFKENATVPTAMFVRVHVDGVAVANSEARQTQGLVTLETGITTHALLNLTASQTVDVRVHFATNDGYVEAITCAFWGAQIA